MKIIFNVLKTKIYYILVLCLFIACVEPFELNVITTETILIVDGTIDDSNTDQFINLKKFIPTDNSNSIRYLPETKAKVTIIENGLNVVNCVENTNGYYYLPLGFKAKVGNKYKLRVELADGNIYESSDETMKKTPPITDYTVVFDPKGIKKGENYVPAHLVYVSTKDDAAPGDNYMWTYRLYEKQTVCKTCEGGIFLTSPAPLGKCSTVRSLAEDGVIYDYRCDGNCWEVLYSEELNVMSDALSGGKEIKNRLVAKIPFYQNNGFVVQIKQQNVSAGSFQYLKILGNQSQNNGTLVDSPPAALIGNLKNIKNSTEAVGGYFMVGEAVTKSIWVDRTDTKDAVPIYLMGRAAVYEPANADGSRPPFAPCIKTNTRTPLKPEGWPL
ncbi:DUF4249 domain-containing protein [Lacihabitans sp. LS3-19]|uniref:DUF4249 domain-containing protein n=1 Tax=Lacihabitans sp. LS3-19 TaxID=2487335 RepID=UPI0020CBD8FB|nr:DUF4249 domain-containing protein [Lacihabitans sp. LS3-19]